MDLDNILDGIRKEIDVDDAIRERAIPHSRQAIRKCSESIKMTHRGEYEKAESLLKTAHEVIVKAQDGLAGSSFLMRSRILDTAYQELAEAANILSLLRDSKFTSPKVYGIPSRQYLTGLADTVGELRRAALNRLRLDNVDTAEELLHFMEIIFESLVTFDYPNALIPDLRRKCDVARSLVERTRGDVTNAIQSSRLVKELRAFDERLDADKRE